MSCPTWPACPSRPDDTDLVCITQNETSTATQLREGFILNLYNRLGGALLAVDATSSLAGLNLKYIKADIWYGSVQKCFGLPAGLGVMILSPRAVAQAKAVNDRAHYNGLPAMLTPDAEPPDQLHAQRAGHLPAEPRAGRPRAHQNRAPAPRRPRREALRLLRAGHAAHAPHQQLRNALHHRHRPARRGRRSSRKSRPKPRKPACSWAAATAR